MGVRTAIKLFRGHSLTHNHALHPFPKPLILSLASYTSTASAAAAQHRMGMEGRLELAQLEKTFPTERISYFLESP